jgi:hypothetical protein
MYKLHKTDFDDIALMLLQEYLASVVDRPREVDINYLSKDCLYLDLIYTARTLLQTNRFLG